jgi:hypothetical protein
MASGTALPICQSCSYSWSRKQAGLPGSHARPTHPENPNQKEKTMKAHRSPVLSIVILITLAILLSACQVNFKTDIQKNGSGIYTQEIGFQGDESSMAGLSAGDEDFCSNQNSELPPGTTTRQETRNTNETWCVYETPFASLEELKAIYGGTDTVINDISLKDGELTYDITLDLSTSTNVPSGAGVEWLVTLPGKIIENNATEQDGNTLKWVPVMGEVNNFHAVSNTGGTTFGGGALWYIIGGAALCLCLLVLLIIAGVIILLIRRNKKKAVSADVKSEPPLV